jgi:hypothetical protein
VIVVSFEFGAIVGVLLNVVQKRNLFFLTESRRIRGKTWWFEAVSKLLSVGPLKELRPCFSPHEVVPQDDASVVVRFAVCSLAIW